MALSGYTSREDGTKLSENAYKAEREGKFGDGNFRKHYGVAKADYEFLKNVRVIEYSEWHHTGKNFKETDFFKWADHSFDKYSDGNVEEGSFADIYHKNKKKISNIVKRFNESEFIWEDQKGIVDIPELSAFEYDYWKNYMTSKESDFYDRRQGEISNMRDYSSSERRSMHQEFELSYAKDMIAKHGKEMERDYHARYDELEEQNNHAKKFNERIDEINAVKVGKETCIVEIMRLFGRSDKEARAKANAMSHLYKMEQQDKAEREERARRRERIDNERERLQSLFDKWVDKKKKSGKIIERQRLSDKEKKAVSYFEVLKEEMQGRYGWFAATSRYNMPIYYSGIEFADKRTYNDYQKKKEEIYKVNFMTGLGSLDDKKKKTDMDKSTSVCISFIKKDIRCSFDTIKNEHEQLICAFEIRPRYATALRHGSNHLSGAKVDDFSELNKKLDRKIKEWQKKGLSVQDIFLFISLELRFRPSKKNDKYHSFYLGLFENKQKYTIRISDHHLDATNDLLKDEKNTTSVTFEKDKPEDWDVFKADAVNSATEYVYKESKLSKEDLIHIAKDIVQFIETGKYIPSVKPENINVSPLKKDDLGTTDLFNQPTSLGYPAQVTDYSVYSEKKFLERQAGEMFSRYEDIKFVDGTFDVRVLNEDGSRTGLRYKYLFYPENVNDEMIRACDFTDFNKKNFPAAHCDAFSDRPMFLHQRDAEGFLDYYKKYNKNISEILSDENSCRSNMIEQARGVISSDISEVKETIKKQDNAFFVEQILIAYRKLAKSVKPGYEDVVAEIMAMIEDRLNQLKNGGDWKEKLKKKYDSLVTNKVSKKFDFEDYTANDVNRPSLSGIYHEDGYTIASDAIVLVAKKDSYNKSLEGKITWNEKIKNNILKNDKDTKFDELKYPNWKTVIPKIEGLSDVDIDWNELLIRAKRSKNLSKLYKESQQVFFLFINGEAFVFDPEYLAKFAIAAIEVGAKKLYYSNNNRIVLAEGENGKTIVMPRMAGGVHVIDLDYRFPRGFYIANNDPTKNEFIVSDIEKKNKLRLAKARAKAIIIRQRQRARNGVSGINYDLD